MDLAERRHAPRFQVQLKASASHASLGGCPIEVSNISQSGLQFRAEQAIVPLLIPKHPERLGNRPQSVCIRLELPQEKERIQIDCTIVYVRRSSLEHCLVGCQFELFVGESAEKLERYLNLLASQ